MVKYLYIHSQKKKVLKGFFACPLYGTLMTVLQGTKRVLQKLFSTFKGAFKNLLMFFNLQGSSNIKNHFYSFNPLGFHAVNKKLLNRVIFLRVFMGLFSSFFTMDV